VYTSHSSILDVYENINKDQILLKVKQIKTNNKFEIIIEVNLNDFRNIRDKCYSKGNNLKFSKIDENNTIRYYNDYFTIYSHGAEFNFYVKELLNL